MSDPEAVVEVPSKKGQKKLEKEAAKAAKKVERQSAQQEQQVLRKISKLTSQKAAEPVEVARFTCCNPQGYIGWMLRRLGSEPVAVAPW